ncbi:MAG TPA: hypothetical protein VK540_21425 [Polyangiaceae bacterium]|nr:hypothetical protein [Polyangiaceae bacterium]
MTRISRKCTALTVTFTLVALTAGCGGRTTGDPNGQPDTVDPAGTTPPDTPLPTCTEICDHVIGTCALGANTDACKKECEVMRTDFKGCKQLDTVLRCMPTAPVKCLPGEARIVGCDLELGALGQCRH